MPYAGLYVYLLLLSSRALCQIIHKAVFCSKYYELFCLFPISNFLIKMSRMGFTDHAAQAFSFVFADKQTGNPVIIL